MGSPVVHWYPGGDISQPRTIAGNLQSLAQIEAKNVVVHDTALNTFGIRAICYNMFQGFEITSQYSIPTWDALLPAHDPFFKVNWNANRRPGFRYELYTGARVAVDGSSVLTDADIGPGPWTYASNEFAAAAVNPFVTQCGFTRLWLDATSDKTDAALLESPTLSPLWAGVGGELFPSIAAGPGGLYNIIHPTRALRRPFMCVARNWNDFYLDPLTSLCPPGAELHICPQFGDTFATPAWLATVAANGFTISPYDGFQTTMPDSAAWIKWYYNRPTRRIFLFG